MLIFFLLGGNSIKATVVVARIHKQFNVKIPLREMFKNSTVRGLATYIKQASRSRHIPLKPAEKRPTYSLSAAQSRLFLMQHMEPESTDYNISQVMIIQGTSDEKALETAFRKIISRHESLRTSFVMSGDEAVQVIHDNVDFAFEHLSSGSSHTIDVPSPRSHLLIKSFSRPFDLSRAPLIRVGLIRANPAQLVFIADMHHIISDGTSVDIMFRELMQLYRGMELPALKFQYKDYSVWRERMAGTEQIKRQEQYWLKRFDRSFNVPEIPPDFPRGMNRGSGGAKVSFKIHPKVRPRNIPIMYPNPNHPVYVPAGCLQCDAGEIYR